MLLTPLRVVLIFLAVSLPVLFLLPYLKVGPAPAPSGSLLEVRVSAPFLSPYELEHQVIGPLENALSAVRGLRGIRSVAQEGGGAVTLEFRDSDKRGVRRMEVAAKLRSVYRSFPDGVSYPAVEVRGSYRSAGDVAVLEYYIYGQRSAAEARKWAAGYFRKLLGGIGSISDIQCTGGEAEVLQVLYDRRKMYAFGISPGEVRLAFQDTYRGHFPWAVRDTGGHILPVSLSPRHWTVSGLGQLPLASPGRLPLQLSDVAVAMMGQMPATGLFRVDGREVARVRISVKAGVNSVSAARRIHQQVVAGTRLQDAFQVRLAVDYTEGIKAEVSRAIYRSAASMLILILLLGISYRRLDTALILLFGLGVNLSLAMVLGWMTGLQWHPYTLAGLGIAFGLMVDNAIVMLDACRRGLDGRIFPALLTATLTSMAALLLVFVLPADYRENLGDFALIVFLGLLSSLLTVKWLVPACYRLWAGPTPSSGNNIIKLRRIWYLLIFCRRLIAFWGKRKVLFVAFWVLAFGIPVFVLPYQGIGIGFLDRLLESNRFQRDFRPYLETFLGGTLMRFTVKLQEASIFKAPLPTALFIHAELPQRHTLEQVNAIMHRMEELLAGFKGLAGFYTIAHDGRFGEITVHFSSEAERQGLPLQVQAAVERLAQAFSGVQWRIFGQGAGFNRTLFSEQLSSTKLIIKGYDYKELMRQEEKTAAFLGNNMRVAHIRTDMAQDWGDRPLEEWHFALDPQKLAAQGIDPEALATVVQSETVISGFYIDHAGGNLNVRLGPGSHTDLYHLLHQSLSLPDGRAVYLKDLGGLEPRKVNNAIYRENRQYIRIIGYEYIGDYGQANILNKGVLKEIRRGLPPGFTIESEEESVRSKTVKGWLLLLLLLPCVNFFLCAVLFESLWKPLLVLLALPVSFIGIFLVFGAGYFNFDHGGIAAFVLLGGISVNAVIFMLQDLVHARGRGGDFGTRLIKVVFRRSGAILLTVSSTICGFIPFLAAGRALPFWSALSAGTIAGLLMSLVAVFLIVPVLMWKKEREGCGHIGG